VKENRLHSQRCSVQFLGC